MSSKEEKKTTNQEKAMGRIQAVMDKYRIIKAPMLINDVMKFTFGDLKDDEDKADKAFKLISGLVNSLVENGALDAYNFVATTYPAGQETPSIIQEQMLVLPSFQLAGWQRTSFEVEEAQPESPSVGSDDDANANAIYDVISDETVSQLINENASRFAIISSEDQVTLRDSAQSAAGKFLEVIANDEGASLYALIPIRANVSFGLEQESVTEDEPINTAN